jgi:hypothetical protein
LIRQINGRLSIPCLGYNLVSGLAESLDNVEANDGLIFGNQNS